MVAEWLCNGCVIGSARVAGEMWWTNGCGIAVVEDWLLNGCGNGC